MGRIKNIWPIIFIGFIVLIISFRNYIPGTWLTGWDNLNPEFNFPLNIHRSIFSVWQEYQGLGSIGGLAYGSDLIRQIILRIISFVLPTSLLRYIYTFTMLLLGPLGVYVLLKKITFKDVENSIIKVGSFLGAVFYLLNLATVQIFFTPFESFTAFYGFLPWCIFSFLYFLKHSNRKTYLIFFIINILAMTQFYVSTIFIVFCISLILICTGLFIEKRKVSILKISSKLFLTVLFVNAFWLLPFIYFTVTHINQPVESHMNMMSTEDIYLRNKQYGDLADVILLKGFAFNYVDKDASGNYSYLMSNWREHIDKPYVKLIGFGVFLFIILGLFHAHKKRKPYRWPFTLLYIFSFMMLANDTPPFSFIVEFLRIKSSLFAQIFRVSFTKFGNLALFSYSIFFAYGITEILSYFNRLRNKIWVDKFILLLIILGLGIYTLPVFNGELFYYKNRIKIPDEYFKVMDFFNKQPSIGRIALLPQFSYWGWNYYKWGYGGSGFLWYGLKNPTLDRAFDGYRKENENYYWEISNSLYSGDLALFEKLLEKYQIEWVLFDENIIGSVTTRVLYMSKMQEMIGQSAKLNLATHSGRLKVYHVNLNNSQKDFVYLLKDLPSIGPEYKWGNYDKAYEEYGDYISDSSTIRGVMVSRVQSATSEVSLTSTDNRKLNTDNRLSGGFGGSIMPSGSILTDHKNGDQTENSHDENYRPESRIGKNISSHNLNLLTINQLNPKRNIVVPKLDSTTPISFLSTNSEANKKAKETTPAFIQISENNRYSDLENRNISSEYHGNNNIVNQVFAADDSVSSTFSFDVYYPFRSLFTGRQQSELEFGVEDKLDYFSFKAKISKTLAGYKLEVPALEPKEVTELDKDDLNKITAKTPEIYLDEEFIDTSSFWGVPPSGTTPESDSGQARMTGGVINLPYIKNGDLEIRIPKINGYYSSVIQPTTISLEPKSCDQFNNGIYKHDQIDINGERLLQLTSINSSNCLDFDLPLLSQDLGYLVTVEDRNVEGKSLLFSVINKNSQRADIETYLPERSELLTTNYQPITSYFIIPPMEQFGLGYTLHLDNISIGRVKTVNDLGKITVNSIPYRFLTSLKVVNSKYSSSERSESRSSRQARTIINSKGFSVDHPNPSFYQITVNKQQITDNNTTLVLSQSFDSGWHAYDIKIKNQNSKIKSLLIPIFPFFFGQEIKDHVLVNNWENGWNIANQQNNLTTDNRPLTTTIIIVYLPQYLEYIGFILFGVGILFVFLYPDKTTKSQIHAIANKCD